MAKAPRTKRAPAAAPSTAVTQAVAAAVAAAGSEPGPVPAPAQDVAAQAAPAQAVLGQASPIDQADRKPRTLSIRTIGRAARRRAGMTFGPEPVALVVDDLDAAALDALRSDPQLVVTD